MFKNIGFAGTPDIASKLLQDLIINGYNVTIVYTQPDRPKGRNKKLALSPVKQVAIRNNIPVLQPKTLKELSTIKHLQELNLDILIVFAYGLILPAEILKIPKFGCFNIHTSLLPKYRGASPVQHSILNGDKITGVSIIKMDPGLDTGDIWHTVECQITDNDTTESLYNKLQPLATMAILHVLKNFNFIKPESQNHALATYAHKIKKSDAKINWSLPAIKIERQIRAFIPNPIAFTIIIKNYFDNNIKKKEELYIRIYQAKALLSINNNIVDYNYDDNDDDTDETDETDETDDTNIPGKILSVNKNGIAVATGNGILVIEKLQFPGGKILKISELINASKYRDLLDKSGFFM